MMERPLRGRQSSARRNTVAALKKLKPHAQNSLQRPERWHGSALQKLAKHKIPNIKQFTQINNVMCRTTMEFWKSIRLSVPEFRSDRESREFHKIPYHLYIPYSVELISHNLDFQNYKISIYLTLPSIFSTLDRNFFGLFFFLLHFLIVFPNSINTKYFKISIFFKTTTTKTMAHLEAIMIW